MDYLQEAKNLLALADRNTLEEHTAQLVIARALIAIAEELAAARERDEELAAAHRAEMVDIHTGNRKMTKPLVDMSIAEIERLQAENERLQAENALLKSRLARAEDLIHNIFAVVTGTLAARGEEED